MEKSLKMSVWCYNHFNVHKSKTTFLGIWWLLRVVTSTSVDVSLQASCELLVCLPACLPSKLFCVWSEKSWLINWATVKNPHLWDRWTVAENEVHKCFWGLCLDINLWKISHIKMMSLLDVEPAWSILSECYISLSLSHTHTHTHNYK